MVFPSTRKSRKTGLSICITKRRTCGCIVGFGSHDSRTSYQRIDFGEHGYIEATRDDTDEIQDFRLKAFMPDGSLVRERRILYIYNIQYDYRRSQEWKASELIYDALWGVEGYGHLQWENSVGCMPHDWKNPYPDNYEPVKPEGCYMFHCNGYHFNAYLYENMIEATMNCYIYDDLDEGIKPEMNLITDAHVVASRGDVDFFENGAKSEQEELRKNPFNPAAAREEKLKFLEKYGKVIGVPIPYDPRFID